MKAAVEGSAAERFDDGEKEKKKKRRSNRRSKQNPPSSSASEVNEAQGVLPDSGENGTPNHAAAAAAPAASLGSSLKQVDVCSPNDQEEAGDLRILPVYGGGIDSKSFSEPTGYRGSSGINKNKEIGLCGQKIYFTPHWSVEAVEKALEKGDVFKALFHVNAHNRTEAYCKINGMCTDVLIGGIPAQNRAVEGDIVALKIDPLPLWTKMKGPNGSCNNTEIWEGCNLTEDNVVGNNICKGKGKVDSDYESANCRTYPGQNKEDADQKSSYRSCNFPEKTIIYEDNTSRSSINHLDLRGMANHGGINGHHCEPPDSLQTDSCSGQSEVVNTVEKLCLLANSFPSKRPTGRVIAIIERSKRREGIVGHLHVKQWVSFRDINKMDVKKNKNLISDHEYIQLVPTDSKFPNMMLLVRKLPTSVKKRLKSGDMTIEMDLVAAQIDDWVLESPFPEAHFMHVFGRGSEVQTQLDAILFQNAICLSEFPPEALSCLPCVPWEVPLKEIQSRIDLRNLCLFTIDPSTATDLDDALSIEKLPNGNYRVGVHIADVSYFVLPDTALDSAAQFRSTCVYMLQKKLPMLPALLSENIGSLSPGVDRLAVSILLDINLAGDVVDRWIGRTVIHSCCKLSYEHAQDIIDGAFDGSNFIEDGYPRVYSHFEWPDVIKSLKSLYEISSVLKQKRFTEGALGLENPKIVFLFDDNGIPYDSMLSERKESNFLVEEYMLLANRIVAEVICRAYPDGALLRRHPEPNMRKLREFMAFCQKLGFELDTSSSGQLHWSLEKIREKLKGDPYLHNILISFATRPMQLASYFCSGDLKGSENEWGHYALAVPFYTHFTSPLRRYPDIIVHRTLLATIEAEELYMKHQKALRGFKEVKVQHRCFTGINFDKSAAESMEGREALSAAAVKHSVPCAEILTDIAAYCNERKLASRSVKDACDKLYIWFLLKKKEVLLSEARILGLGPRFMSIYIQKLAIERRIYYDEVLGLTVEWLETTSTLVLSMSTNRCAFRRACPNKWRAFKEVALLTCPCNLDVTMDNSSQSDAMIVDDSISAMDREPFSRSGTSETEIDPAVFPLTVRLLSTIPVVLHAVGGDDGPLDIGVRLYMSSYFG